MLLVLRLALRIIMSTESIGSIISQEGKIPHHQNFLIVCQNFKSRKLKWQTHRKVLMM